MIQTRPILIDVLKLLSGSFFGSLLGFLLQIIIARNLSINSYGEFSAIISFYAIIIPLMSFGIGQFWLREFGKFKISYEFIFPGLKLFIINIIATFFIICLCVESGLIKTFDYSYLYYLLFLYVLGQSSLDLVYAINQVNGNYTFMSILNTLPNLLRIVGVSVVLLFVNKLNINIVSITYSIVGLLILIFFSLFFRNLCLKVYAVASKKENLKRPAFNKKLSVSKLIHEAWPFALGTVFHLIYFQSDIFLLHQLLGSHDAGRYSAMFIIIGASLIIPNVIYQKYLLPKIHKWSNVNTKQLNNVISKGGLLMLSSGLLIMLFILFFANNIISILFKELYLDSIGILKIMSINIPLLYLSSNYGVVLFTGNLIKLKISIMGFVALLNIVLNVLFIPKYGVNAALLSTLCCNVFILLSYYFYSKKYVLNP